MSNLANALQTSPDSGQLAVLRVGGADARAFLQGQLSNDLRLLARDNSQLAAFNTPQGRVIAVVRLFERAEAICVVLPRSMMSRVTEGLRRYVLRSKVTLAAAEDLFVVPLTGNAARAVGATPQVDALPCTALHTADDDLSVLRFVDSVPRALLIGADETIARYVAKTALEASSWNDWRLAQIAAGEPQIYPATSEQFVAQMLNLDLVGGISFTKGCYTGQEIIVRTHHLGRIKRRMLLGDVGAPSPSPHDKLLADGQPAGEIVDAAAMDAERSRALAVIQLGYAMTRLTLERGSPLSLTTLPYAT